MWTLFSRLWGLFFHMQHTNCPNQRHKTNIWKTMEKRVMRFVPQAKLRPKLQKGQTNYNLMKGFSGYSPTVEFETYVCNE